MKKVITTTTIQNPTKAIEKFDQMKDWTLIVAGDLKTPKDYKLENGIYLSPQEQEKYNKTLSDLISWNTHARRNFGHLLARDLGADIIAMVDDDNIPLDNWGEDLLVGKETECNYYETDIDAFDPIGATNYPHLWHRGFPVQLITKRNYGKPVRKTIKPDVQADFWNGDPDIDAVCRMIYSPQCKFNDKYFPISSDKPSPFNSQNVFVTKEILPHCFILPHISPFGRQSDIWMSYHVQSLGYRVVYGRPSVYQDRNKHDLTLDMKDELIGYEKNIDIVSAINRGTYRKEDFWPERALRACEAYQEYFNLVKVP